MQVSENKKDYVLQDKIIELDERLKALEAPYEPSLITKVINLEEKLQLIQHEKIPMLEGRTQGIIEGVLRRLESIDAQLKRKK